MTSSFRAVFLSVLFAHFATAARGEFTVVANQEPRAVIFVDSRNANANGKAILLDAARWLSGEVAKATGAKLAIEETEPPANSAAIVIARADAWPEVARDSGLKTDTVEAYALAIRPQRLFVLGRSESAARFAVADLLRGWGFRYFAPSPKWHFAPRSEGLTVAGERTGAPALLTRKIWYAYGHSAADLAPLTANHQRWSIANRLSDANLTQTGHSYGNIVLRNEKEFAAHPEYFALLPDGQRDATRAVVARKFCFSNPGLQALVAADRLRLLEEQLKVNPAATMVSVDPSDGEGTCHCAECAKLGTTTDRVLHLANHVARRLREKHPQAWVGLYAYSSHRLPPAIAVEPNVYVQVAMGFNRTQYSLPELVERWSRKVSAIGLREYYGVEAWDWGLPGRMRGSQVEYHRRWIPYFADRKVNAINAETNSNWGGQTLGHYVAAQLMWNPHAAVEELVDEFFRLNFGDAAAPMRRLYARFDAAPSLRAATLLPMFDDLRTAWDATHEEAVRQRLSDLMAYLVYVSHYRDFELAESRQATRNDAYYAALRPLMQYAYQIRDRDTVHYYALARRLCNGLPVKDGRLDFYLANKEAKPVWMTGALLTDNEVRRLFDETADRLRADKDPTVTFSRYLEKLDAPGDDAGPSGVLAAPQPAIARFRKHLRGYFLATGQQEIKFGVHALSRTVKLTVFLRDNEPLFEQEFKPRGEPADQPAQPAAPYRFEDVAFVLPKAGEYRVELTGDFVLQVPRDVPLVYEASPTRPAWVDYSGPHYFFVPRGVKELYVDANPRLSLVVPGKAGRMDITPEQRVPGQSYAIVPVPESAAGQVWHTSNNTRGQVMLLNVPPLLSFHRDRLLVPREVVASQNPSR